MQDDGIKRTPLDIASEYNLTEEIKKLYGKVYGQKRLPWKIQ